MRSILLIVLVLNTLLVHGEGSKQIQTSPTNTVRIQIGTDQLYNFGTYSSTQDKRIYFRIENPADEQVFVGFGKHYHVGGDTVPLYYRIKDPSGNVVVPGTLVPTTGKGFIENYTQNLGGPLALDSTAQGYDAILFKPALKGDYNIEFSHDNTEKDNGLRQNRIVLDFFDLTVAADSVEQEGRLWAYSWSLYTGNFNNEANSKFFIYTPDSLVSRVDLNGLQAYGLAMMANQNGTQTSSQFEESRKSALGNQAYAQYKIFINGPDSRAFPISNNAAGNSFQLSGCYSDYCFNIATARSASGRLNIDFNGNNIQDAEDISIMLSLIAGDTCIPWNGRNALGRLVAPGTAGIKANLQLFAGRTNFLVYDAEFNRRGFKVDAWSHDTVNATPLTTFWDDSNIDGLNSNTISGCLYTQSPLAGCHTWEGNIQGAGNNNTMNTWWYMYEVRDTIDIIITPSPIPIAGNDTVVCIRDAQISLGTALPTTSGATYQWQELGPSQTIIASPAVVPTIVNLNNTLKDSVVYLLTTTLGSCQTIDTAVVYLKTPKPIISGPSQVCAAAQGVQFWLKHPLSTTATWTLSSGRVPVVSGDTITVNEWSQLTLPFTERVKVVTTYGAGCSADSASFDVQVTNLPVTTGLVGDTVLCNGDTTTKVYAVPGSPRDVFLWTVDGALQTERSNRLRIRWASGSFTHVITVAQQSNGCVYASDSLSVRILPPVNPFRLTDTTVCQGSPLQLSKFLRQPLSASSYKWSPATEFKNPYTAEPGFQWADRLEDSLVFVLFTQQGFCTSTDTLVLPVNRGADILSLTSNIVCNDSTAVVTLRDTLAQSRRWFVNEATDTTKKVSYTTISANQIKVRWDSLKTTAAVKVISAGTCKTDTATIYISYPRYEKYKPVGDSGFCFSKPVTAQYVVRGNGGGRFTWGLNSQPANIGTFVGSTSNDTIQVTWSGLGTANLWVLETGAEDSLCTVTPDTLQITLTDKGSVDAGRDTSICFGESVVLTASGGSKYSWNPGNASGASISVSPAATTNYIVNLLDPCKATDTVTVSVFPVPKNIISDSLLEVCFDSPAPLPVLRAAPGFASYLWNPGNTATSTVEAVRPAGAQDKVVYYVAVKDAQGCAATDSVVIVSSCEPKLFLPDAFSPNDDDANDVFKVYGRGFKNFEMSIFNRWGEVIFTSKNTEIGWDGKYLDQRMPAGVYPWVIYYEAANQIYKKVLQQKGSVILVR